MPRVANYVQDREFADSFVATFDQFYKSKFPGYLSHIRTEDRSIQLKGVDLIVMDREGGTHTVDEKANRFGVSPDEFILEIWQDSVKGRAGWFVTGKAEWLVVGKAVENNYIKIHLVNKKRLKEWIDRNPDLVRTEVRDFSDRGGKTTEILLVPTKYIQQFGLGPFWLDKITSDSAGTAG